MQQLPLSGYDHKSPKSQSSEFANQALRVQNAVRACSTRDFDVRVGLLTCENRSSTIFRPLCATCVRNWRMHV
jgi:hypothetical protein